MPISFKNRVTEKDIRDWLNVHGFVGRTAKIHDLDLYAIKRPGWVQVFEFRTSFRIDASDDQEIEADSDSWHVRFGVVLDDERNRTQELRTQIWMFDTQSQQQLKLDDVSQGMLTRNAETNWLPLLWIAITAIIFVMIVAIASWIT